MATQRGGPPFRVCDLRGDKQKVLVVLKEAFTAPRWEVQAEIPVEHTQHRQGLTRNYSWLTTCTLCGECDDPTSFWNNHTENVCTRRTHQQAIAAAKKAAAAPPKKEDNEQAAGELVVPLDGSGFPRAPGTVEPSHRRAEESVHIAKPSIPRPPPNVSNPKQPSMTQIAAAVAATKEADEQAAAAAAKKEADEQRNSSRSEAPSAMELLNHLGKVHAGHREEVERAAERSNRLLSERLESSNRLLNERQESSNTLLSERQESSNTLLSAQLEAEREHSLKLVREQLQAEI